MKFFGDENVASASDGSQLATMDEQEKSQSFIGQSLPKRAAIVVAGPMANFLLAIIEALREPGLLPLFGPLHRKIREKGFL